MPSDDKGLTRRSFLRFAAAGLAGSACSPKAGPQKLVPFLVPPDEIIPGRPLFYRSVCRECPAGCGLTVRTREGRAVKLEGNPEDPIGGGALCARGQAAIQALYAPGRLDGPRRRGADGALAALTWEAAAGELAAAMARAREKGPGRVRLLTRPETGTTGAIQKAVLRALGAREEDRVVVEPFDLAPLRAAEEALHGTAQLPVYDLTGARTVVAFGADFLETWLSPVELTRQFAHGRGRVGSERTRLVWVAPRMSATGFSADRWVRVRAGGEVAFALSLLRWLSAQGHFAGAPELTPLAPALAALDGAALAAAAGVPPEQVEALGQELVARRPSALLGPGMASQGGTATQLASLLLLLNRALGNEGRTVLHGLDPLEDPPSTFADLEALLRDCAAGAVDVLLVHHVDPVGAAPLALGAAAALSKVPLIATFSSWPDRTGALAHLHLPDHHALEALGEVTPRRGVVAIGQPAMTPLGDTRAAGQLLLDAAAKLPQAAAHLPYSDLWDFFQARSEVFLQPVAEGASELGPVLRAAQERGGVYLKAEPAEVVLDAAAARGFLALPAAPAAAEGLDLVLFPTALRGDGEGPRAPWLDEASDTVTTLSWTGWAELSPAAAARLEVSPGDLVALATAAGSAEVPVYVYPGLRDDAVAVPLGGPEAAALVPAQAEPASGALQLAGLRATVKKTGRRVDLPALEGSPYQEGREIVKNVRAAAPAVKRPDLSARMYPEPEHPVHRWGMAVDLDRCTGCQACVVACYAENNIPVMGREAAVMGRQMGWIRIERYLGPERGTLRPEMLPMMCQHCTNAPCEPVCPVYATYHTPEGLNAQVYNRCVGTRYCSNNCPYKVRTFNWRDTKFTRPLDLQLNPDVTVRSKGVMEKCTFCVQRIRFAEGEAKTAGRAVADGEITPACAQTCPARAIVFGDLHDPASRVSLASAEPRGFQVLEEVNTRPAVTYLARVREEEP